MRPATQGGAAALVVTVLLCFAMALAVAVVHRSLVIDQRTAAHQVRATQAFEAAEAGIEWTLAALNDNRRVGDDCLPDTGTAAISVRDRLLDRAAIGAPFVPRMGLDHGAPTPIRFACDAGTGDWVCACPTSGPPSAAAGAVDGVSFVVQLSAGDGPGVVKVTSIGCSSRGNVCDGAVVNAATTRISTSFALLRGVASLPTAPLVAKGDVNGDAVAWIAANVGAATGGLAVQAGGDVHADHATLRGPAGSARVESVMARDASLGGRTSARFVAAFLGIDGTRWAARPGVRHIVCVGDCSAALQHAIDEGGHNAAIAIDGDLRLDTPVALGSPDRPVVIMARGAVRLNAATTLHGVLEGAWVTLAPTATGSAFHGAVLSAGDVTIEAASSFVGDAAVLARVKADIGTFARVSGSWRDF